MIIHIIEIFNIICFFVDCEFLPLDLFRFVCERKDIRILKRHVDELNELFVSGAEAWAARKKKNVWAQEFVILGVSQFILEIAYENAWKSLGVDFFSLFSCVSWVKLAHGQDMEGDTANRKHQETSGNLVTAPKETAPSATLFGRPDGVGGLRDLARASAEAERQ